VRVRPNPAASAPAARSLDQSRFPLLIATTPTSREMGASSQS